MRGEREAGCVLCDSRTMRNYPTPAANSIPILVLPCPVLIVNRQGPEKGMVIRGSDTSGMRIWVMSPDKSLRPVEVRAEGKGNLGQIGEEGECEYHLQP